MPDISSVLGDSLYSPGELPSSGAELVSFAGGKQALLRELSGMSAAPKRSSYGSDAAFDSARKGWRSAQRRVQRYTAPAGRQQRRPVLKPAEQQRVTRAASNRKLGEAVANGVRVRMTAKVKVPTPPRGRRRGPEVRERTMPAGGPGELIKGDDLIGVLEALDEGNAERAAFEFEAAFGEAYGFQNFTVEDVSELKIWPEGTDEP